jgi:hypothetical protein
MNAGCLQPMVQCETRRKDIQSDTIKNTGDFENCRNKTAGLCPAALLFKSLSW